MVKTFFISFLISLLIITASFMALERNFAVSDTSGLLPWWEIQSVDTMKYSRDLSREKNKDPSFDTVIDTQMKNIAATGATHVGIATPYDQEFIPFLARWVTSARKHNLNIWFRGNFSGWEKWFDYPAISREQHVTLLADFINGNPTLFREGDIFTPCPECENGGPGDPRVTKDIQGHQNFLIREYDLATSAFRKIGINVRVGYFSMNYDVARVIMDKPTTDSLGGIVTIDHYVESPEKMVRDIHTIAEASGGKVFLGEFGAPIPDIHGKMSESEQYRWLTEAFTLLVKERNLIGVNYWVNVGGSTPLWTEDGTEKRAVKALTTAYTPLHVTAKIVNQLNKPITNVEITSRYQKVKTDRSGQFTVPYLRDETELHIIGGDYADRTINISDLAQQNKIIIEKKHLSLLEKILAYILALFSKPQ